MTINRKPTQIGIVPEMVVSDHSYGDKLKRAVLVFDKLIIPSLEESIDSAKILSTTASIAADLEWLVENEIIAAADERLVKESSEDSLVDFRSWRALMENFNPTEEYFLPDGSFDVRRHVERVVYQRQLEHNAVARFVAQKMRAQKSEYSFPVFSETVELPASAKTSKNDVIRIVIEHIPVPTNDTPWEKILDFRADRDSELKLLRLRRWITEIADKQRQPSEIEEEIQYLTEAYKASLLRHQISVTSARLECIVTFIAEIFENLVKLKLSALARMPFEIKNRNYSFWKQRHLRKAKS